MLDRNHDHHEDDGVALETIKDLLQPIREICNSYTQPGAKNKHDVQRRLLQYACQVLDPQQTVEMPPEKKRLQKLLCRQIQTRSQSDLSSEAAVVTFNIACQCMTLALWLQEKKCAPNTLLVYCSRLSVFVMACITCPLHEIDLDWAEDLMPLTYSDSTRNSIRIIWRKLHRTLHDIGLAVPAIDWRTLRLSWRLREVSLIGQKNIERLLAYLTAQSETASYYAVLLAYFWGLRLSEVVKLTLGDVVLGSSQPFLYVQKSKRGRSRIIYTHYVPDSVCQCLLHHWKQRIQTTDNRSTRFLVDHNGQALDADALSASIIEALLKLGIRTNRHVMVFHTLRHDFANRLFVLNVDVREIAKSMGHRSADTTIRNYLHCFAWKQKEILAKANALDSQYLSQAAAARYLDVDRRHVKNLLSEIDRPGATIKHNALFTKPMRGKEAVYLSHSSLVEMIRKRMK